MDEKRLIIESRNILDVYEVIESNIHTNKYRELLMEHSRIDNFYVFKYLTPSTKVDIRAFYNELSQLKDDFDNLKDWINNGHSRIFESHQEINLKPALKAPVFSERFFPIQGILEDIEDVGFKEIQRTITMLDELIDEPDKIRPQIKKYSHLIGGYKDILFHLKRIEDNSPEYQIMLKLFAFIDVNYLINRVVLTIEPILIIGNEIESKIKYIANSKLNLLEKLNFLKKKISNNIDQISNTIDGSPLVESLNLSNEAQSNIKKILSKGEIKKALNILAQESDQIVFQLLKIKLEQLERDYAFGTITQDDYSVERSKITLQILRLIK